MKFSDFNIGAKLGAAFFVVVSLTALVGAFAVSRLGVINAGSTELATNSMPSIRMVGQIRITANQFRRAEAEHVLATDEKEWAEIEKRFEELKKKLADQQAGYEPLASAGAEANAYAVYKQHRDAYFATVPKLAALSRGGEKTSAQTRAYFGGESKAAFNTMAEDLGKLVEINEASGDATYHAASATFAEARTWLIGLVIAALVVAAMLAFWITRMITTPMAAAVAAAQRIAAGDLTVPIDARGKDETAQLLRALSNMKDKLSSIVGGVRQNAEGVATASAQIAEGNNDLSGRTEEQASALQQTAASMEELGATVRQNAENARQADQLALGASTVAIRGGDVVARVVDTMKGINDSSKKIADIISVIDGIAFQTNILALNAAVEAARAGEQGRGFAVVASEVRSLAQRSAEAAKEIKLLITASVERVGQGTVLVDQAGATMTEIVTSIKRVTDIMSEISAASIEQSAGVAQIGEAVGQMDTTTQQNAALVEESAAAAESLRAQATQLVQAVAVFKLDQRAAGGAGSSSASAAVEKAPERRSPERAKNVVRPQFKSAPPTTATHAANESAQPANRTGTDDWTAF